MGCNGSCIDAVTPYLAKLRLSFLNLLTVVILCSKSPVVPPALRGFLFPTSWKRSPARFEVPARFGKCLQTAFETLPPRAQVTPPRPHLAVPRRSVLSSPHEINRPRDDGADTEDAPDGRRLYDSGLLRRQQADRTAAEHPA